MKTDVAIIGAGPAGLSAAINLKILNVDATVLSPQDGSDKVAAAPKILNYLGKKKHHGQTAQRRFFKSRPKFRRKNHKSQSQRRLSCGKGVFCRRGRVFSHGKMRNTCLRTSVNGKNQKRRLVFGARSQLLRHLRRAAF